MYAQRLKTSFDQFFEALLSNLVSFTKKFVEPQVIFILTRNLISLPICCYLLKHNLNHT